MAERPCHHGRRYHRYRHFNRTNPMKTNNNFGLDAEEAKLRTTFVCDRAAARQGRRKRKDSMDHERDRVYASAMDEKRDLAAGFLFYARFTHIKYKIYFIVL